VSALLAVLDGAARWTVVALVVGRLVGRALGAALSTREDEREPGGNALID
jgi:hypothetical protein